MTHSCDFRAYGECGCPSGQCQQQTYTTRAKQLTDNQNEEWRAYHRAMFSSVSFTVLCAITAGLLAFGAFQAERQERVSNLINQEDHHG
ncbi:hypothetical protein [Rhizobium sp. RCAM05973]|uniref:hypothetical protein n=1 Tax=Rhizobium sp. RCAM05973 TaxID=2994066 RepID=UPI0022EBFC9E|nr:hypothetical protein [Rhizobium sp. RCAM05973]